MVLQKMQAVKILWNIYPLRSVIDGMTHDLRFAWRMILAQRWFSVAVVVTLALGIGLNTMVFTLVNAVLLKPVGVPGGARLVAVNSFDQSQPDGRNRWQFSLPELEDYRAQMKTITPLEGTDDNDDVLSERGIPPQVYTVSHATTGIFSMLHVRPVLGRDFVAGDGVAEAAPVVMLSYGLWQDRYHGDAAVIGRAVHVNEKPATIIGVMPKGFRFPMRSDLWMALTPTADLQKRENRWIQAFGMLRAGAGMDEANAELKTVARQLAIQYPDTNKKLTAGAQTFNERYNGGNIRMVFLLMMAAVGFVLLIACANVANMMLSRTLGRQREMSIRTALGASRWRVVRQLLLESVMLSCMGGLLGLVLAAVGVHWFDLQTSNVGKPYWIEFTMNYTVFGYFAALCVVSGLVFGLVPALRSSNVQPNDVLKEGARSVSGARGGRLSAVLVVMQFALTLVLLTGAGIFVRSLLSHLDANQGVPSRQLLAARIEFPQERYKDEEAREHFYDQLLPQLRAIPGVSHVALTSSLPGMGAAEGPIELEHSAPVENTSNRPRAAYIAQSPGYLDAIRLPLLAGRDFNAIDGSTGHKVAILTRECAAHFWPKEMAIGKRFRFYEEDEKTHKEKAGDWITVVGVAGDLEQNLEDNAPKPLLFVPYRQQGWNGMSLVVESKTAESGMNVTAAVRSAVQQMDGELPLRDIGILRESLDHQQWYLHLFSKLFLGFAGIGLLMASVGLYAVIAYAVNSRTQEIGVRMALGANARNILLMVMRRGLVQIGAGLVLGLAAAYPVARVMASMSMGLSGPDPTIFVSVAMVLCAVSLFACWLPARRAAALDPVKAIRYE
jgi:putative ABC transport system permease protein